jgi:zinc protease
MSDVSKTLLLTLVFITFTISTFAQTVAGNKASIAGQTALVTEFDVNGLKVLVKHRANSPTVAAGLFIRGGARNINAQNAGIENLMLEVSTESSKSFPRETLRRELASTGSSINSGATNDYSVLSLASTRQNFDRSWNVFTDIALNPIFATADLEQVRQRLATGLREQETDNDNFLHILQDRIIYANHPYANSVSGTLDTINRLTAKDLSEYHKKVMQTSQLLLVVVGDIDAKDLQTRVAATLGKLPRGNYKEQAFPALDFSKATLDVTPRTLPTNYVQGVFNAPSPNNPDYYAMRVAIALLQSRVFDEVRLKRQLSYAPNAELDSFAVNTGNIYVTAVDANQAVSVMLNEVKNLQTRTINPEILESISGHFLTKYYLAQETNGAQAAEIAKYELIGGGWRNAFQFLDKVREVTPQDIQTVSNKYIKNLRFVVVGNPQAVNKDIFLQN